jgi:hypothetical protein
MQLKIIEKYLLSLALVIFLTGCTDALYFYETEKISLTIEARPDSSQPVQGNLGIKERVVLVGPKKAPERITNTAEDPAKKSDNTCDIDKNKDKKNDIHDSVSAISSFNFNIIDEDGFNPVLVQTAFITGEAAACLTEVEAQDAAQAITLDGIQSPGAADISIMGNVVERLIHNDTKEDNKHLSLLNSLAETVVPKNYPVRIFDKNIKDKSLTVDIQNGSSVSANPTIGIRAALTYWGKLGISVQILEFVLNNSAQYKYNNVPLTNDMVNAGLRGELEKTKQESERIGHELTGNSIYINALQFYIDKYIKHAK